MVEPPTANAAAKPAEMETSAAVAMRMAMMRVVALAGLDLRPLAWGLFDFDDIVVVVDDDDDVVVMVAAVGKEGEVGTEEEFIIFDWWVVSCCLTK